ncbi:alpha/beta fold hydrolase [Hymenobacter metallilatus]|uniref:Alpha/beta hydrolase n=1 Tax=Hymenobacter metallilatus TaxID=2493666 RepID=A0A428JR60_9BACT|nr:alpha/beta hydrolase [Hymenobacter metallilatus]RSK36100.1 alpha/beta hydrolase [Hymenobacter metallilatus]
MLRACLLLLPFLLTSQLALGQQAIPYGHNPAAGKYATVRGLKLYYETYGTGAPLLLLHGNGGSSQDFAKTIPYFAKKYRVIALDSRAHGQSVDAGDSLSFELLADDCAALLAHLRLDSAYVLGWSDGGITALLLAQRHPEKVKRLAATGANLWPDSTALMPELWQQMRRGYQEGRSQPFTDPKRRNDWKVFLLDWRHPHVPLATLAQIKAPAFIIAGDRDVIRPEHTVAIYQHLSRAWLWIVPNSGHATLHEHADVFNRKVDEFFRAKIPLGATRY